MVAGPIIHLLFGARRIWLSGEWNSILTIAKETEPYLIQQIQVPRILIGINRQARFDTKVESSAHHRFLLPFLFKDESSQQQNGGIPRYNLPMPMTAAEILEAARQLAPEEPQWLVSTLQEDEFAAWQKEAGEPEPGYEEWFRASVEEALADDSPDVPHEEAMQYFHEAIQKARKLKATA